MIVYNVKLYFANFVVTDGPRPQILQKFHDNENFQSYSNQKSAIDI